MTNNLEGLLIEEITLTEVRLGMDWGGLDSIGLMNGRMDEWMDTEAICLDKLA